MNPPWLLSYGGCTMTTVIEGVKGDAEIHRYEGEDGHERGGFAARGRRGGHGVPRRRGSFGHAARLDRPSLPRRQAAARERGCALGGRTLEPRDAHEGGHSGRDRAARVRPLPPRALRH